MRENGARQPARAVCVHGAGAGGWEWGIWARVLAVRGFDVLAPDLMPGDSGLAQTTFADYRRQVVAWCRGAGEGVVLIGASLGGLLALVAVQEVRPAALVMINPLPPAGVVPGSPQTHPAIVPWSRERSLATTRRAMSDADDAACLYALRRWRDESGAVLNAAREGVAADVPPCPALVLASELDTDVPPAVSRALAARLSADFHSIPKTGHTGPLLGRDAADIAARTVEWLRERTGAERVV